MLRSFKPGFHMMTPIAPIVSNTFLDDQNNWDDCWFPYNRLDHPKNWRRVVVSIRDFKIVGYGWLQRLKMCHARKTLMRCHRRASDLRLSVFPRFLVVAKTVRIILTEISFYAVNRQFAGCFIRIWLVFFSLPFQITLHYNIKLINFDY